MPNAKTRPLTRQKSDAKYGQGPRELSKTEPRTYRRLFRYSYRLKNTDPQSSFSLYYQQIKEDLMGIRQAVNPRLPLISTLSIEKKIRDFLQFVKYINRKHNKAAAKRNLANNLDSFFNVAGCSCSSEVLPCDDRRINCDVDNCQQKHTFCSSSPALEVPIEARAYLRDQRLKKGSKGLLQIASVNRVAVKRALRLLASFPRSTVDSDSFPCTSIQSSTDIDSASVHSEAVLISSM